MKIKKKEDQTVDASVLLRTGSKILMEANAKGGAETEGKAIQRLPQLRIYLESSNLDNIADARKCLLTGA